MPQQTKIFRVFVSSTFTDMKLERGILQRDAFPRLEKFCEEKGAKFQAVDLRWGVDEESSLNQKTLQICFNEIARCQKVSPRPNFLILLGDKYGWQPIPEIIPEDEMNLILGKLEGKEKELIENWYKRDENAIPPEYVLQPRENEIKEYKIWELIETNILTVLREAVKKLNFTFEQRIKYFTSAIHQEIVKGVFNSEYKYENQEGSVFAFSRTIDGLPEDYSADGFIDIVNGILNKESKAKLIELKNDLRAKLGEKQFKEYKGSWSNGTFLLSNIELQEFNDNVFEELRNVICEQLEYIVDKDELVNEIEIHKFEVLKLTDKQFSGQIETLKKIQYYIHDSSINKVFSLLSDSGQDKSNVIARAIRLNQNRNAIMVFRFIGASSRSSNVKSLLHDICKEIARAFSVTIESLAGEGREKSLHDIQVLAEILHKALSLATEDKPVLLFLDALELLADTENAKSFYWIPKELPAYAKMIISSLPDLEDTLNKTYKEFLPVLSKEEAVETLKKWFISINRRLTSEQYNLVISSFNQTASTIYLKLAYERAKQWHSYDQYISLKDDVYGIINDYLDHLERKHTSILVRNAISYMLCSMYQGLAETDIREILAFDQECWGTFLENIPPSLKTDLIYEKKIPHVIWSRLLFDLDPYIAEKEIDGIQIIIFSHRQFTHVLRERYNLLESPDDLQGFPQNMNLISKHSILAQFYYTIGIHRDSQMAYRCLPYHARKAKSNQIWVETITDFRYLSKVVELLDVIEVTDDNGKTIKLYAGYYIIKDEIESWLQEHFEAPQAKELVQPLQYLWKIKEPKFLASPESIMPELYHELNSLEPKQTFDRTTMKMVERGRRPIGELCERQRAKYETAASPWLLVIPPKPTENHSDYIFISYKREDLSRIVPFMHKILEWGFQIWYDQGIPGGAEWDALIEEKVINCKALLVFLSEAAVESKWVRREIKFADSENLPILGVRLDQNIELKYGLKVVMSQYQMIDATNIDFSDKLRDAIKYVRLL